MTQQTQGAGNALAQVKDLIFQNKGQLVAALPSHLQENGTTWLASAYSAVQRNTDLVAAVLQSPHTFTNALNECASLGLVPGTPQYYLTPRRNKGKNEVLGVVGYQGEIELIYRAGAVASVIAEVVRENDEYRYNRGADQTPSHIIKGGNFASEESRGALIGVYAYAVMKDGAVSRVIELNGDEIKRRKAMSAGSDGQYSPWVKWEVSMWLKSAIHDLEKWVPTSAEYAREKIRAQVDGAKGTTTAAQHAQSAPPAPQTPESAQRESHGFEDLGERGVDTETGEMPDQEEPPQFMRGNAPDPAADAAWMNNETSEGR